MSEKYVMVLEISNVTDEQIQAGLGEAFNDFCNKYKGAGIKANVLNNHTANRIIKYINEESI